MPDKDPEHLEQGQAPNKESRLEPQTQKEIQQNTLITKRSIAEILIAITVIGGTPYAGHKIYEAGMEAGKEAVMEAAETAVQNRLEENKENFFQWQKDFIIKSKEFIYSFEDVIDALKNLDVWKDIGRVALKGAYSKILDMILDREFAAYKLKDAFNEVLQNNPELSTAVKNVEMKAKALEEHIKKFQELMDETFDIEKQKEELMKDFYREFQERLPEKLFGLEPKNTTTQF